MAEPDVPWDHIPKNLRIILNDFQSLLFLWVLAFHVFHVESANFFVKSVEKYIIPALFVHLVLFKLLLQEFHTIEELDDADFKLGVSAKVLEKQCDNRFSP